MMFLRSGSIAVLSFPAQARPQLFLWIPAQCHPSHIITSVALRNRFASTKAPNPQHEGRKPLRSTSLPSERKSSKSVLSSETSNTTSATALISFHSLVEPPSTILPPPLEIPEPTPGQSKVSQLFTTGKAYWRFYKAGVKQTWANMKTGRELRKRKQLPFRWYSALLRDLSHIHPSPLESRSFILSEVPKTKETTENGDKQHPKSLHSLTRAEFQFLRREGSDTLRLPVFGLILLIFGEWTPLIVVAFGGLVPHTCRIPRQINHSLQKRHRVRETRLHNLATTKQKLANKSVSASTVDGTKESERPKSVDRSSIIYALAHRLGTYSAFSDVFNLTERRLLRRLRYLDCDDALLLRDSKNSPAVAVQALGKEEVKIACDERGIDVLRKTEEKDKKGKEIWKEAPEQELRRDLKDWLQKGGWKKSKAMDGLA